MNNDSNLPQPGPRNPGQPRMFAIVYLGGGSYGLDLIEAPSGPRRLRRSTSIAAIRKHLAKLQAPGDIVLMSEALRALETLSAPVARIKLLESATGPDIFRDLGTAECVPELTALEGRDDAARRTQGPKWSIQITCSSPLPRHRIEGLLGDSSGSDGSGREPGEDPPLN